MVAKARGDGRPLRWRVRSDSVRILVVGAAGMIGRKLAERLAQEGRLGRPISHLTLADVGERRGVGRRRSRATLAEGVEPLAPPKAELDVRATVADLADPAAARELVAD